MIVTPTAVGSSSSNRRITKVIRPDVYLASARDGRYVGGSPRLPGGRRLPGTAAPQAGPSGCYLLSQTFCMW